MLSTYERIVEERTVSHRKDFGWYSEGTCFGKSLSDGGVSVSGLNIDAEGGLKNQNGIKWSGRSKERGRVRSMV